MQSFTIKTLTLSSPLWTKLNELNKPPKNLYYTGEELEKLYAKPIVAVVGSRKMTPYGRSVTESIVTELTRQGIAIISGNAFGVDALAQQIALNSGGEVISVIPSDLEHIYPASNRPLAERIIRENGVVISEYRDNPKPRKDEFLQRNRLIAALSDAVIITEAAERSGSLNTARWANEIGRPVFAVPGPINSLTSKGTNDLIKNKSARLLSSANDIVEALGIKQNKQTTILENNTEEGTILEIIRQGTNNLNEIALATNMSAGQILSLLTTLEIEGFVSKDSLGNWQLSNIS